MNTAPARFHELDDLVLNLKGLVLVRDIRRQADAAGEELAMYDDEIGRVRARLADLVRNGCDRAGGRRLQAAPGAATVP